MRYSVVAKPKIALYWCSSCGGCEESLIDLGEDILLFMETADIRFWPVAMDFKYGAVKTLGDSALLATLINGAIRMDEQEEMAMLLRRKSKLIVAHGSCAHTGGVVGLANFYRKEDILKRTYKEIPTVYNPEGTLPQVKTMEYGRELRLPDFYERVKPLDRVVDVDYTIPGCPPTPDLVKAALMMILENRLPQKGRVLADSKALCDTCPRKGFKWDDLRVRGFKRLFETDWDPSKCFFEQEILCMGPATRGGCGARCIHGNMPCRGCFGPTDPVDDQGAKFLSFLAALVDSKDGESMRGIVESIPDPAGLFYRYSLASSILKGRVYKEG